MKRVEDMKTILLITAAIDITKFQAPYTVLTALDIRLQQYLNSLEYAIENYNRINHIIFCDNTGYKYDYSKLQKRAEQKGKTLEVFIFRGNYQLIQEKGKGYGEGEIVKHALNNSEVLNNSFLFYKMTGRIVIKNMDQLMDSTYSDNAFIFLSNTKGHYDRARTLFYKVNTSFYKQHLMDAYMEVNDHRQHYLEHAFYERLANIPIDSFGKYPDFIGLQASTGSPYQSKSKLMINRLYNQLDFFSNKEKNSFQKCIFAFKTLVIKLIHWIANRKKRR